ncbi:MAG: hypothetical protein K0U98_11730 [Deltaproteobacteria bacterium]|nr:hypothetical protein [Deltaproteobacteria bacterium]
MRDEVGNDHQRLQAILERSLREILSNQGVTAAAIGRKQVGGIETEKLAIVVFVKKKHDQGCVAASSLIPREIEGALTDVVEREFSPELISTNPMDRFDPLISGVAVAPAAVPSMPGSIGCFLRTPGKANAYPPGVYLLTNEHVVGAANPGGVVLQPDWTAPTPPPANYQIGNYLEGFQNATADCAIVDCGFGVAGARGWKNVVPNKPLHPGNRRLSGVGTAAVGDAVYKFGAKTRFTTAHVLYVAWASATGSITNAIYIENRSRELWVDGGDSGSVAIGNRGDLVLGLNFRADTAMAVPGGGYYAGMAYPIQSQFDLFATQPGTVTLA